MEVTPIILTGGSGKRLWPISRSQYPKQFLPLINEKTILQNTAERLNGLDNLSEDLIVLCNEDHKFLVSEQLKLTALKDPTIIVEPVSRNTAIAIYVASLHATLNKDARESILLILPSDHLIEDTNGFHSSINKAINSAKEGKLVTLGVTPTGPSSDYGYIKKGNPFNLNCHEVEKFIEKPETRLAENFLQQGGYLWNSGMFIFRADVLQKELSIFSNDITSSGNKAYESAGYKNNFIELESHSFSKSPDISIDHALMEKTKNALVAPLESGWSDLGGWGALNKSEKKDNNGNVALGDVVMRDTKNSYISSPHKLTATLGLEDLTIVNTPDALLIASKDKLKDINLLVSDLSDLGRKEKDFHRKVYRPWGWYDSLESGDNFQVKRICVLPGSSISLQKHFHRSEHWTIIKGEAKITCGSKVALMKEDESIYIPKEAKHRLENLSNFPVEIIEVQYGSYLGEDDIERFEDMFGRE